MGLFYACSRTNSFMGITTHFQIHKNISTLYVVYIPYYQYFTK